MSSTRRDVLTHRSASPGGPCAGLTFTTLLAAVVMEPNWWTAGDQPLAASRPPLEPTDGLDVMRDRRGLVDEWLLCTGPGRLGQALGITGSHDGLPLDRAPFDLQPSSEAQEVLTGVRVGVSKAHNMPSRFGLPGSRFVSRRFA